MHEMGLALEILKATRQAAKGRSVGHLEEVQVMVGELSSVEPDLLVYAWEAATKGSAEEGSTLTVLWHPARQTCDACGVVDDLSEIAGIVFANVQGEVRAMGGGAFQT